MTARETGAQSYKVICVSLYLDDLSALDALVARLKAEGKTDWVNRSSVIRLAVKRLCAERELALPPRLR